MHLKHGNTINKILNSNNEKKKFQMKYICEKNPNGSQRNNRVQT